MRRINLTALEVFFTVAQYGSFRKAAMRRGVNPSALSHVVRSLEENVGVRLFHRTSRSVSLTEAGRQLLQRAGPAISDLAAAVESISTLSERPAGLLRLNMPRLAAGLIVEPIVGKFLSTYPEIRLEVVTSDDLVDIVAEGFDDGIRRDRRLTPGMIALPVGPARRFAVVGAPSYLAGHDRPRTPRDLHAHRCIERRFPSGSRYAWEFEKDGQALEVEVSGPLTVDDTGLMVQAALDGVSLACIFKSLAAEHLDAGRLVRVLAEWCPTKARFFLYYPGRRQVPVPLRAFIEMARAEPR